MLLNDHKILKAKNIITLYMDEACRQNPTLPIPPKQFFIIQWEEVVATNLLQALQEQNQ
jgi:hypothetical protein